ncbi:hypothetical protein [Albibacillus kandeliae]|uniref:hypothetical protein n=1 Tax=Albibacillus kandeliae TaxID=2174228 RepID=UPI0013002404|nr:hypothetical protein [Albibacillus kandeliae]
MLKSLSIMAVALTMTATSVTAAPWVALNRNKVNPLPDGSFEVIARPGDGGAQLWCAAGDYAVRVLRARAADRIYITRGRAAPETGAGKSAVQFSMTPPPGVTPGQKTVLLNMKTVGDNLSSAFAQNYCNLEWELH